MKKITTMIALVAVFCLFMVQIALAAVETNAPMGNRFAAQPSATTFTEGKAQRILGTYIYANQTTVVPKTTHVNTLASLENVFKMKLAQRDAKKQWKQSRLPYQYKYHTAREMPGSHFAGGAITPIPENVTTTQVETILPTVA